MMKEIEANVRGITLKLPSKRELQEGTQRSYKRKFCNLIKRWKLLIEGKNLIQI